MPRCAWQWNAGSFRNGGAILLTEQVLLGEQPVFHIRAVCTASLQINFIRTLCDLFMRGMRFSALSIARLVVPPRKMCETIFKSRVPC
jgi:hypothetical protein